MRVEAPIREDWEEAVATEVQLDDLATVAGVYALRDSGLLEAGRADTILA